MRTHSSPQELEIRCRLAVEMLLEGYAVDEVATLLVEYAWSWLKYSRLNNFAPRDARQLNRRLVTELMAIHKDQRLLESFVHAAGLPIRLDLEY